MEEKYRRIRLLTVKLTPVIALSAALASGIGFFGDRIYRDNAFITSALRGNDLVTLFLAIPLLCLSALFVGKGKKRTSGAFDLLWSGSLLYMVYNYLFYLYGASFNRLFLLYVLTAVLSLYSLIFSLVTLDVNAYARDVRFGAPTTVAGSYLVFFGSFMLILWTGISLGAAMTGTVPPAVTQTGHSTAVVFATDLVVLIPAVLFSGVLLLKSKIWGYVLSAAVLTKACAYSLVLIVMHVMNLSRGEAGDPFFLLWAVLGAGAAVSLVLLLRRPAA